MLYRKLVVNGREFEYTIGYAATKVKGVGSFVNEFVGQEINRTYRVTPKTVAEWIQKQMMENSSLVERRLAR